MSEALIDNFRSPLLIDKDQPYVGNSTGPDGRGMLHVVTKGVDVAWDEIDATYPDSVTEVYSYKFATILQLTLTVVYTDASKALLQTVTKVYA